MTSKGSIVMIAEEDSEYKGLHTRAFHWIKEERSRLWDAIQKNLGEVFEDFKKDPEGYVSVYKRTISEDYLRSCDTAEKFWVFLILKLSLSELSDDKNVFNYYNKTMKDFYEKELSFYVKKYTIHFVEGIVGYDFIFSNIFMNDKKGRTFLNYLSIENKELYEKLKKYLSIHEELKEVWEKDEALEGELNKKLMMFLVRHPIATKNFISFVEDRQPSLEDYLHANSEA